MKPSPTREALLEAACVLFYQRGSPATSVDAILEKAGVARQSLYLHFTSKDGLIAEFLKVRDERWRGAMQRYIATAGEPDQKLLAIFDFLASWFAEPDFHGCAFINTAVEYADPQHPFHQLSAEHKARVRADVLALCLEAGLSEAEAVAGQLALLMEGATVTEQVTRGSQAARQARQIAEILIYRSKGETDACVN
jgi:AcrR family transcriptional regulator